MLEVQNWRSYDIVERESVEQFGNRGRYKSIRSDNAPSVAKLMAETVERVSELSQRLRSVTARKECVHSPGRRILPPLSASPPRAVDQLVRSLRVDQ